MQKCFENVSKINFCVKIKIFHAELGYEFSRNYDFASSERKRSNFYFLKKGKDLRTL